MKNLLRWTRWIVWVWLCAHALLAATAAAADLSNTPILQLDPGAHGAPARRIAISRDQRFVATASDDKTVRLWHADGGKLLHVLRPPIGAGTDGRLYGLAFHPSQALLAVGGTGPSIGPARLYFFEPQSGELLRSVDAGPGEIKRLVWSADGRWLVAGFAAPGALKVFSSDGRRLSSVAFPGDCYGLALSHTNAVAATDTSGSIRLFQLSDAGALERPASVAASALQPIALAHSPDGKQLAVVHFAPERNGAVDLMSAADGAHVLTLRSPAVGRGRTQAVAWSKDGTRLAIGGAQAASTASGREAIDAVRGFVQEFDLRTRSPLALREVASDAVTDLARFDDGGFAFSSFDASWGVLDAAAQPAVQTQRADYVRRADRLWLAPGGAAVQWQTADDAQPRSFRLSDRAVRRAVLADVKLPDVPGALSATHDWESHANPKPMILGGSFELAVGEISRAVARIPRSEDVAWGTGHRLARIGPGGRVIWSVAPGAEARAVHCSEDGRFVVAAMSDGAIRWYRARDGVLLLSMFATKSGQWVLWSPLGYYDASPGAEQLIGWHVNRMTPLGQAAEFFTIGRFRDRFHRPDVIDRLLAEADEALAVDAADRRRAEVSLAEGNKLEPTAPTPIATLSLPPALVYKQARVVEASSSTVALNFGVLLPPGEQLTSLVVRRDGILQPSANPRPPTTFDGKSTGTVTVEVPVGESVIHVAAANAHGFSDALAFTVQRQDASTTAEAPARVDTAPAPAPAPAPVPAQRPPAAKPRLFVLAIGVGRYADARVNPLGLPAKDATDFAAVFNTQSGQAYASVATRVLTEDMATKEAISKGLSWLAGSVTERDFGILFMAGHAVNHPNGSYYFLSHDTAFDRLPATSVDEASIRTALVRLKGRAVLFVDTCHAGNALGSAKGYSRDVSKIANTLAAPENGVIVFASSTGRQESQEKKEWGNGAFTKALIAGLRGRADLMQSGRVTFQGLGYYVSSEVEKLTNGEQTPVMIAPPPGLPDFTLALVGSAKAVSARPFTVVATAGGTSGRENHAHD